MTQGKASEAIAAGVAPLFTPLSVRGLTLANRIVMSPMTRGMCPHGVPGADVAAYYERRAQGGCGLIITEGVAVDHPAAFGDAGLQEKDIPRIAGHDAQAGWRRVTDRVHAAGGRIVVQLWHQGILRKAGTGPYPQALSVSPSGLWGPTDRMSAFDAALRPRQPCVGMPMQAAEIEDVLQAFVRSACNAMAAGFDGIALHGAHGYLIDQFQWSETNQRDDDWGGDLVHRCAFPVELVRRIRVAIGDDAPIFFRFSQWKQQDFKARLADTADELAHILRPLAQAGVDVFDASVRYFNTPAFAGSPLTLAGWARHLTGKAAMAVGGIGTAFGVYDKPQGPAQLPALDALVARLSAQEFDLAAVGRAFIGDAGWARKIGSGEMPRPFEAADLQVLH